MLLLFAPFIFLSNLQYKYWNNHHRHLQYTRFWLKEWFSDFFLHVGMGSFLVNVWSCITSWYALVYSSNVALSACFNFCASVTIPMVSVLRSLSICWLCINSFTEICTTFEMSPTIDSSWCFLLTVQLMYDYEYMWSSSIDTFYRDMRTVQIAVPWIKERR